MADGPQFDFLADSWGIGLSVGAKTEIAENAESLSRRHIEEYIKDTDIRKFGVISSLPKEVSRHVGSLPPGKYFVQVQKSVNITQPSKFQEEFDGGKWRLLALEMSDGEQKLKGIEYAHTNCISVDTWPGTKLLLVSSAKSPLSVSNGHILLTDGTVQLIGGQVPKLVESWKQSKEVQENRLLWKSEGVKKKEDGEGAPLWVDFDPRKAPRSGHRSAEEERKEWQKTMIGPSSGTKADDEKQRDGPRFQAEDFAEDGVAPKVVSSQVSANAFKKDEGRKGKGKGKGESGSRSEGGRRGRGDDDYEPDKPAAEDFRSLLRKTIQQETITLTQDIHEVEKNGVESMVEGQQLSQNVQGTQIKNLDNAKVGTASPTSTNRQSKVSADGTEHGRLDEGSIDKTEVAKAAPVKNPDDAKVVTESLTSTNRPSKVNANGTEHGGLGAGSADRSGQLIAKERDIGGQVAAKAKATPKGKAKAKAKAKVGTASMTSTTRQSKVDAAGMRQGTLDASGTDPNSRLLAKEHDNGGQPAASSKAKAKAKAKTKAKAKAKRRASPKEEPTSNGSDKQRQLNANKGTASEPILQVSQAVEEPKTPKSPTLVRASHIIQIPSDSEDEGSDVKLHIYDLHKYTKIAALPFYHLGIELYEEEYYFGVEGIEWVHPGSMSGHVHKKTLPLGRTQMRYIQVQRLLEKIDADWQGTSYKLLSNNCQTFAVLFCVHLGLEEGCIPAEWRRFSNHTKRMNLWKEKRAPVANASLAAFIKPTKKGELPDEALNLLAADSTEATGASAWDGGDWEESSWDASGWGQGWSGGYSGGGGGGYGGGGGQRKGGGKGRGKGGKGKGGGGKRSGGGGKRSGGGW